MEYKIISNQETLDKYYNEYYFKKYKKRKKRIIEKPWHPSLNKWIILRRPSMNNLKQQWKEYGVWLINYYGLANLNIEKCIITFKYYMPTKRRADNDNMTPKFFLDAMVESELIKDDSYFIVNPLILWLGYDKNNPRMEIHIKELTNN